MNEQKNKNYDGNFKLKVALAAIKGDQTIDDLCQVFDVARCQVYAWKKHLEEHGNELFIDKRAEVKKDSANESQRMIIEQLKKERDFLVRVLNR